MSKFPQLVLLTTQIKHDRTRTHPSPEGVHAVQELLRVVSTTREAQEIERKRRLAWEQELEARYIQRQAEMERMMFDMRQEISSLRNFVANSSNSPRFLRTNQFNGFPPAPDSHLPLSALPISPISQPPSFQQTTSVVGCSRPLPENPHFYPSDSGNNNNTQIENSDGMVIEPPSPAPSATPPVVSAESLGLQVMSPNISRKRQTPDPTADDDDNSTDGESSASLSERPSKRTNHHDTRCLSIHVSCHLNSITIQF